MCWRGRIRSSNEFWILDCRFRLREKSVIERSWMRLLDSLSDNLKPVVSNVEPSKTCTEPVRSIQNRKWPGVWIIAFVLVMVGAGAEAQQPKKIPRIGYLSGQYGIGAREEAFRKGLSELGYVEGQNIIIEWRFTEGKRERYAELAADLVRLKADCIITVGTATTHAAKQVTTT